MRLLGLELLGPQEVDSDPPEPEEPGRGCFPQRETWVLKEGQELAQQKGLRFLQRTGTHTTVPSNVTFSALHAPCTYVLCTQIYT